MDPQSNAMSRREHIISAMKVGSLPIPRTSRWSFWRPLFLHSSCSLSQQLQSIYARIRRRSLSNARSITQSGLALLHRRTSCHPRRSMVNQLSQHANAAGFPSTPLNQSLAEVSTLCDILNGLLPLHEPHCSLKRPIARTLRWTCLHSTHRWTYASLHPQQRPLVRLVHLSLRAL